jgi:cobalt-zinc-cadmium efflux system membrane fusion protein
MTNWRWVTPTLLVLAVIGVTACSKQHQPSTDAPPMASAGSDPESVRYPRGAPQLAMIQSQSIPASPLPLTEVLSGRVAYDEDVTAHIAVSFSGRIVALRAEPGDSVRVGQPLADIDSPDFGTARAELDKARAEEAQAHQALERAKNLVPGEAIAAKEWEAAQADYAQAQAETARAAQHLKNLNPHGLAVQGQRVSLASPLNGVITERTATPALEVGPGLANPLFVVTDPSKLWLMIDLPEALLGRVKTSSEVEIESDAYPGERFSARIVQIGGVVDPNTRRVTVRARLDNPERKLLPEMFVRASILQANGSGVRVPNSAIVIGGVHAYVFVETKPGEFHRHQVELLTRGSDFSYVGNGLSGGERIVTKGAMLLDAQMDAGVDDPS